MANEAANSALNYLSKAKYWFYALLFALPSGIAPFVAFSSFIADNPFIGGVAIVLFFRVIQNSKYVLHNNVDGKSRFIAFICSLLNHRERGRKRDWRFLGVIASELLCCFCYLYAVVWRYEHRGLLVTLLLYSVFWTFVVWKFFIREREGSFEQP